jgi:hypothetical protein
MSPNTVAFAIKLSRLRPDLATPPRTTLVDISEILRNYPIPNFYVLIKFLLSLADESELEVEGTSTRERGYTGDIFAAGCRVTAPSVFSEKSSFPEQFGNQQRQPQSHPQDQNQHRRQSQNQQYGNKYDPPFSASNDNEPLDEWMFDPNLIESLGFPEQGNLSFFDFDSLCAPGRDFYQEQNHNAGL